MTDDAYFTHAATQPYNLQLNPAIRLLALKIVSAYYQSWIPIVALSSHQLAGPRCPGSIAAARTGIKVRSSIPPPVRLEQGAGLQTVAQLGSCLGGAWGWIALLGSLLHSWLQLL